MEREIRLEIEELEERIAPQVTVPICHVPPGQPENAITIPVGPVAVATHIAQHGDTEGACS